MTATDTEIRLSQAGGVTEIERTNALDKVRVALQLVTEPVLGVDLRLEHAKDPARAKPASARLRVDLNGSPLRVHVAADTMHEAMDLLFERFRDRLGHLNTHRRALRDRSPAQPEPADQAGPWRHGRAPTARRAYFLRPPEEREGAVDVLHRCCGTALAPAVSPLRRSLRTDHPAPGLGTGESDGRSRRALFPCRIGPDGATLPP